MGFARRVTKDELDGRPFSVAAGRAAGLGRGAMAGPAYDRPFYGVRETAQAAIAPATAATRVPERELLRRDCERYVPRLRSGQFFSHETALVLRGAPAPHGWERSIHVSAYRPASAPRTRGVVGHRLQLRTPMHRPYRGLPVEDLSRAWVQASLLWAEDDLVAAADHLIAPWRGLATIDSLRAEARRMRGRALDDVLGLVRLGSESPRETKLRLVLQRAGLPEPELNLSIRTAAGEFVARIDIAYPAWRVAVEYDGRGHADNTEQFARDADRWDDIRDQGWYLVRILSHHLEGDGVAAVQKVRSALRRAGASV